MEEVDEEERDEKGPPSSRGRQTREFVVLRGRVPGKDKQSFALIVRSSGGHLQSCRTKPELEEHLRP